VGQRPDRVSHPGTAGGAHARVLRGRAQGGSHRETDCDGEDPDKFQAWNAAQLSSGPGYFEYLAAHLVVDAGGVRRKDPSPEFVAEAMFAMPVGIERLFHDMKNQIDADARMKGRVGIALTEYLFRAPFSPSPPDYPAPTYRVPEPGWRHLVGRHVEYADSCRGLRADCQHDRRRRVRAVVEKRGITYGVPSYWAFRMYSNADVANLLDTKVEVARYSVKEGSPRTPEVADVPYLDLVAVANQAGDKITLFGVNRSLTADITSTIRLSGFTVHSASGMLLAADNIYVGNDDERPRPWCPPSSRWREAARHSRTRFPKASVTRIELR